MLVGATAREEDRKSHTCPENREKNIKLTVNVLGKQWWSMVWSEWMIVGWDMLDDLSSVIYCREDRDAATTLVWNPTFTFSSILDN